MARLVLLGLPRLHSTSSHTCMHTQTKLHTEISAGWLGTEAGEIHLYFNG